MDKEVIWKQFGHNGDYRVSDCGSRIQSRVRGRGHYCKERISEWTDIKLSFAASDYTGAGYLRFSYVDEGGKRKGERVHRIVAKIFCLNPNNYREVDHIDGNRFNNHPSNLRWVTRQQNSDNAKERGVFEGKRCFTGKVSLEDAIQMIRLVKSGVPQKDVAKKFKIDRSNISKLMSKKVYAKAWDHID